MVEPKTTCTGLATARTRIAGQEPPPARIPEVAVAVVTTKELAGLVAQVLSSFVTSSMCHQATVRCRRQPMVMTPSSHLLQGITVRGPFLPELRRLTFLSSAAVVAVAPTVVAVAAAAESATTRTRRLRVALFLQFPLVPVVLEVRG